MTDGVDKTAGRAALRLRLEQAAWRERLARALIKVENRRRAAQQEPPLPKRAEAFLPEGPKADLALLNLKVWCARYGVDPEFVLDALTWAYRLARRPLPPGSPNAQLGLAAPMATGVAARKVVEEAVARAFPNGENLRAASLPPPRPPLKRLRYGTPEEMVAEYGKAMARRRREVWRPAPRERNYRRQGARW